MTDLQHESIPQTSPVEPRRSRLTWWLAGGLAIALVALAGLGTWAYNNRTDPQPSPTAVAGLASDKITALLDSRVAAIMNSDKQGIMAVYSKDAIMEERDRDPALVYSGNERIASILIGYRSIGWVLDRTGVAVQEGRFVSEPLVWSNGSGIAVYEIDDQGLIAHQWVIGG